jgi:hypothetical protein
LSKHLKSSQTQLGAGVEVCWHALAQSTLGISLTHVQEQLQDEKYGLQSLFNLHCGLRQLPLPSQSRHSWQLGTHFFWQFAGQLL